MECHANFVNEKPIVSIQTELYNRESGKFLTGSDSEEQGHVGEPGDITINDRPLIRFSGLLNQPGWFLLLYKDESFLLKPRKMEAEQGSLDEPFVGIKEGLCLSVPAVNEITFCELEEGKDSILPVLEMQIL